MLPEATQSPQPYHQQTQTTQTTYTTVNQASQKNRQYKQIFQQSSPQEKKVPQPVVSVSYNGQQQPQYDNRFAQTSYNAQPVQTEQQQHQSYYQKQQVLTR